MAPKTLMVDKWNTQEVRVALDDLLMEVRHIDANPDHFLVFGQEGDVLQERTLLKFEAADILWEESIRPVVPLCQLLFQTICGLKDLSFDGRLVLFRVRHAQLDFLSPWHDPQWHLRG